MKFDKLFERISQILLALILIYFSIKCVSVATNQSFSFDGGMNVQVAQNLYKTGRYATSYNGLQDFSPIIQTGITVLLPVAIVFKLFGESFAHGLIVNALYLILLAFLIVYYLKRHLKLHSIYIVLALLLLFATPQLFTLGYGLLGEIPSVAFFLLSLIFVQEYQTKPKPIFYFLSGMAMGLGYLTKTVILIALPAFVFVALLDFIFNKKETRKTQLRNYLFWILGFCAPILLFEIYKLISLGTDKYVIWWQNQKNSIFAQAGVSEKYKDTPRIFNKFGTHIELFAESVFINKYIILMFLVLLLAAFVYILVHKLPFLRTKQEGQGFFANDVLILFTVTLSYFGWWLIITPTEKAWYRRIINGTLLLEICIPILLYFLFRFISQSPRISRSKVSSILLRVLSGVLIAGLIGFSTFTVIDSGNSAITFGPSGQKAQSLKAGAYIQNLPADAEIFGFGWWQAPLVAFTSGRSFNDIQTADYMKKPNINFKDKYLVIDNFAYTLVPDGCNYILSRYNASLKYKVGNIYIYKINSFLQ